MKTDEKVSHTPGPWNRPLDHFYGGTLVATGNGDMAIDCSKSGSSKEQDQANARLIAAAPELLEMAEGLLTFLRLRYPDEPLFSNDDPNLTAFVVIDLEKAIRKAKGE